MRRSLLALLTAVTFLSTVAVAAADDAPPAKTQGRRRPKPPKDRGPVINAVGFEKNPSGGTRLYVEVSKKVAMSPSGSGRELVYTLSGTHLGSFNDSLPIDTRYLNTPILRARMVQQKKDAELHVSLRADVKPTVAFTDLDGGRALLTIDFADGQFVQEEVPPTPTTETPPPLMKTPPPRNEPPQAQTANPHADDPDYVPRAGTEETIDGRAGKSGLSESPMAARVGHWGLGALGGYAFGDTSGGAPNLYGPGVGGRLGYTLGAGVYLGGLFMYHLGTSETSGPVTVKDNIIFGGGEIGYDILLGPVVIRPSVELGVANISVTASGEGLSQSNSKQYFQLAPGATLLYTFGAGFIGVDVRYWIITGVSSNADSTNSPNAIGLYGTLGANF